MEGHVIILSKVLFICNIPFCYPNLIFYIYISVKTQLYLDRFYVAQSTTCFNRYMGHFQDRKIPQVHSKELIYYFLLKLHDGPTRSRLCMQQVRLPGIEAWYLLQCKCNTFLSYKRSHLIRCSWKKGVEDCLWFNCWILSVSGTVHLKFSGPSYFVQTRVGLTFVLFIPCIANWSTNLSVPTTGLFYILCILLICSYMFWCNRLLQGAYTNLVKTYSSTMVLQ
jgi:hypothetical protein